MVRLCISLMDMLRISLDSQPIIGLKVRSQALLAYLADEPYQRHSRSILAGLLWPEQSEQTALNNLRQALYNLNQVIRTPEPQPSFILADRQFITINPDSSYSVDTLDFRQISKTDHKQDQKTISLVNYMDRVTTLYRGEFLKAFQLVNSSLFEDWVLFRREFYRAQFLETMCQLAVLFKIQGELGRVKSCAYKQLTIEPWREEAHYQIMEALALEGNRSEALAQFRICCSRLKNELNTEPGLKTIQLYERIRDGNISSTSGILASLNSYNMPTPLVSVSTISKTHNLPVSLTAFIGREGELSRVVQLINDQCLVMLTGPAGVGKSRLALETARQVKDKFPDGVQLVDLARRNNLNQALTAVSEAFGYNDEASHHPTMKEMINYLQTRQILLILDNCGHLPKAYGELARIFLQSCPGMKILATSRIKSGTPGEYIFHVPTLAFPDVRLILPLETVLEYAAVRLFVDRAREAQPSFQVTDQAVRFIVEICQQLDGIPLAIEQAASHLDMLTLEQIATCLKSSFVLLASKDSNVLYGHQSYEQIIDWSCEKLLDKEQLLLHRLSIFEGSFTMDAVENICAGEGIDYSEIAPLLSSLVKNSLIFFEESNGGETRFRCLHAVQQYGLAKLRLADEGERLSTAHCVYYAHLADTSYLPLKNGDYKTWIRKLDADRENLFRAIKWAIEEKNDPSAGVKMVLNLERWWMLRGFFEQGVYYLRKGLSPCPELPADMMPLYIHALCLLSRLETNRLIAKSYLNNALLLAGKIPYDNYQELGSIIHIAGFLFRAWDHNILADLAYIDQSRNIFRNHIPDRSWQIGILLDEKSEAYLSLCDHHKASSFARESWQILQEVGDGWFSNPLVVLGKAAIQRREYQQARIYLDDVYSRRIDEEDAWRVGDLESLAYLERMQGHYSEAVGMLREAIRSSQQRFSYFHFPSLLQELAFIEIVSNRRMNCFVAEKHTSIAARLLGAAERGCSIDSLRILSFPKINYDLMVSELQARSDKATIDQAWKEGQAMWIDQAAEYALGYPLNGS